jgi:acyl dehydratase
MAIEEFPVEASHILMFARSIADPNPVYADAAYAATTDVGSVIAPPTFVQASAQFDPDYFLRPKLGERWFGSGATPSGLMRPASNDAAKPTDSSDPAPSKPASGASAGILHAEQHYTYHQPLRAGDVLTAEVKPGATWTKEGRRGGTLEFSESITEYRNAAGELVVTARGVGVRTSQVVKQEG